MRRLIATALLMCAACAELAGDDEIDSISRAEADATCRRRRNIHIANFGFVPELETANTCWNVAEQIHKGARGEYNFAWCDRPSPGREPLVRVGGPLGPAKYFYNESKWFTESGGAHPDAEWLDQCHDTLDLTGAYYTGSVYMAPEKLEPYATSAPWKKLSLGHITRHFAELYYLGNGTTLSSGLFSKWRSLGKPGAPMVNLSEGTLSSLYSGVYNACVEASDTSGPDANDAESKWLGMYKGRRALTSRMVSQIRRALFDCTSWGSYHEATCEDQCAVGQTRCAMDSTEVETCADIDGDGCRDWVDPTACPDGQTCSNDACVPSCTPSCNGKTCGDADGCGGVCQGGSGCCLKENSTCAANVPCCAGLSCEEGSAGHFTCEAPPPPPPPPPPCGVLLPGQSLGPGQALSSCGGAATLWHQGDGNVVVYDQLGALWWTGTQWQSTSTLVMQGDGNLVLYDVWGYPIWYSGTHGYPGAWLAMQDDCNLVIYAAEGGPVWASYAFCRSAPPPPPPPTCQCTPGTVEPCGGGKERFCLDSCTWSACYYPG